MSPVINKKIGIGTAQFGMKYGISNFNGQTSPGEVKKILHVCHLNDIKYIDTAAAYGKAENILGLNDLSNFRIITKFMHYSGKGMIKEQLNTSLNHLKIKSLYGLLAHRPLELLSDDFYWDELIALKESGNIKKIGLSFNTVTEMELLLEKGRIPDIIQVPYNYLDNRFEKLMIDLKKKGCEIHARSIFLQGLFFRNIDTLDSFFDEVKPILNSVKENVKSLEGTLLNFVIEKEFVDVAIIGIENSIQLINNINSINKGEKLPPLNKKISDSILIPSNWNIKT
jgi:aryl-alcohol dehydrogenase-like predicted oxidoreductase